MFYKFSILSVILLTTDLSLLFRFVVALCPGQHVTVWLLATSL